MRIEELFKNMLRSFFIISTGAVASMYVFCLIFFPDVTFTLGDIGRVLLMALASDLPYILFYSRKELGKRQMLVRKVIHFAALLAILLTFAHLWDWINLNNPGQVIVFILLVIGVYAIVIGLIAYQDKKLADKLNDVLKQRYHS